MSDDVQSAGIPDPRRVQLARSGSNRRLMANRDFRNLWISQTIGFVGDWLVVGLLIPIVTDLSNNSATAVAGIMIAKILPSLLLPGVIGAVVDRFDRRRLMMTCEAINSVLCLGLLFTQSLLVIYAIIFFIEVCNLMFVPAKNALIPLMVEERDLAAANGLSYTTQQAAMLIGLLGAGAIVSVWRGAVLWVQSAGIWVISEATRAAPALTGPRAGVILDSLSFLLSVLFISFISLRTTETRAAAFNFRLIGHEVIESFEILRGEKELRGFLTTIFVAILGGGAIIPVGMTYVTQNLVGGVPFLDRIQGVQRLAAQSPQMFILVFLALGMGAGAFLMPRFAARLSLETLFVACTAGFGMAMLGFSSVGVYWVASLFAVAAGFMLAGVNIAGNTYVSETVPDRKRGRVFTAMESVIRVALLLSMIVTAPLGDLLGRSVRMWAEVNHVLPTTIVLTGSRLTLWFASAIVIGAAVYATFAIDWRRGLPNGSGSDPQAANAEATDA